jgi:predicted PurR-regulated permease PerM
MTERGPGQGNDPGDESQQSTSGAAASTTGAPGAPRQLADPSQPEESLPPWGRPLIRVASRRAFWVLVLAAIGVVGILYLADKLSDFLEIIFIALFLSFAIEPAADWFAARGMRRGAATGLVFLFILLVLIGLIALIVPAIVQGFQQVVEFAPEWVDKITNFLNRFGIDVTGTRLIGEIQNNSRNIASYATDFAGNIFGIGASILGAMFRWATIALFTFYFVAQGPQLRRAICSALPPQRQQEVLFIWDQAIEKTGGYFYSRLLLAVINGTGMYITLRATNVPFAAPLAVFEGVVAEFIPIIGTYIAGAAPVLVAVLTSPTAGIAALVYILVYQQIENYFLSPRLTARTMALHPAVAFAAALIGGALGGILTAFLALPVAGVIQAGVQAYGRRYQVVESELTEHPRGPAQKHRPPLKERFRGVFGRRGEDPPPPDHGDA